MLNLSFLIAPLSSTGTVLDSGVRVGAEALLRRLFIAVLILLPVAWLLGDWLLSPCPLGMLYQR